jgi:cadmium resistance protein CadD (predicted permease)
MAGVVYGVFSLLLTFYAKIAALPFLIVLGVGTYLGSLRVSRLLSPTDIDFVRNLMPQRFHRYLPLIAKLAGIKYVLNREA